MSRRLRYLLACLPVLAVGAVALAQGYQPNFIRNFVGPISVTGTLTTTGAVTSGGAISAGSNNITTTGRYCTDSACTTTYIANDGFGTLNLIGSVGGSGNWTTAGSLGTDVSLRIGATALPTCNSAAEGVERRDSAAGGTTGHRTRKCICTSDGAGTPAYAWQNVVSGTVGTSSACAD